MINLHFGLDGHFTIHKGILDANDEPVTHEYVTDFDNLVLDTGLQRIGENSDWMNWLHLGTGITPPQALQSSLINPTYKGNNLAPSPHTHVGVDITDPLNPFVWITRVFRVVPQGVSKTYTELGVGWNDSNLFSRTLIKDPQGNPNSISILGDEYLDVTYECRMYMPVDTAVYSITPTGDDKQKRTVSVHASMLSTQSWSFGWGLGQGNSPGNICSNWAGGHNRFYDGGRGGLYQNPEGSQVGGTFNYTSMVRVDAVTAQFSFTRDLPDNVGTLRTIQISQMGYCYQMELDPPFVKTNEDRFNFGYQITWGRR